MYESAAAGTFGKSDGDAAGKEAEHPETTASTPTGDMLGAMQDTDGGPRGDLSCSLLASDIARAAVGWPIWRLLDGQCAHDL